jgi:hypothetical protein
VAYRRILRIGYCACKVRRRTLRAMTSTRRRSRLLTAALVAGAIGVALVAVPVLGQGAQPSGGPAAVPAASGSPDPSPGIQKSEEKPGKGPKADKGPKAEKVPETPVTLEGTVGTRTDEDGDTVYTLTVSGTVYELEAGPPWFWGDDHPLKGLVGKTVTIEGDQPEGSTTIEVRVADGKTLREPGKPPWAGGWKVQGEKHPGWSQAKADRFKAKFGDCWPPGHCKQPDRAASTGPLGD